MRFYSVCVCMSLLSPQQLYLAPSRVFAHLIIIKLYGHKHTETESDLGSDGGVDPSEGH